MIDYRQVRAARALLDWSQDMLAEMSGVSRATIKNIESRLSLPRLETASALQQTFEEAGVEFLPGSGVRMSDRMINTHEGIGSNKILVEDMYVTLRDSGGEILIAFLDEGQAIRDLGTEYLLEHMRKRQECGITHRLLIHPEEKNITAPLDSYRIIPKEYFSAHPFLIYGPKLALLSSNPVPRVIIIKDDRFVESARNLFNFIWDRTEMPSAKNKQFLMQNPIE